MFSRRIPEDKMHLPTAEQALPGRTQPMATSQTHTVLGTSLHSPFPAGMQQGIFGMGCFWGVERLFWKIPGVHTTAVGYCGGLTPNPSYEEVCSGMTGHNEVVLVVFDPNEVSFEELLKTFWENHDPSQGMRQGNDIGTQYRSGIYVSSPAHQAAAEVSKATYSDLLMQVGKQPVTTEIRTAPTFYYAEPYHQQYLHKNPGGYCNLAGTGVCLPGY